ncbi:aminotransferase class V-fold PLP-dependent enzyme [Rhizobium favelukesii]|nr:aminotransferase class V-fold PLP-dependent enzyme [Rhizobium favelukesii]MCS0463214.1 aminotransferase class V-fold PLP-dependent enzyme [Rhizobium favelukesii]
MGRLICSVTQTASGLPPSTSLIAPSRNGIYCAFGLMDSDDDIVEAYTAAITPQTRILQLTHTYHWNGRVLPVKRLCEIARERKIITIVDGAQTFAQMPVSFRELDCDFFITSFHKWLGAPVGNGMLIVNERQIDRTWPLLAPFDQPADDGRVAMPFGFALTDPGGRISRTRLFPRVTRVISWPAPKFE